MRKKMSVMTFALLASLALACGGTGTGGEATGGSDGDGKDAKKVAKIGEPARDGKFEFTVKKVKCGVTKVGNDFLNATAQGQFCLVTVHVQNIGKEPRAFSDSNQKAYGADGAEFSTDSSAGLYANENADTFFNEINPGNEVTGVLVFDIPKKAELTRLELYDSAFSGGVVVALD